MSSPHIEKWKSLAARLALACLAWSLIPTSGHAMSVSPVYLDMVSTGPRSRADIRVVNRSQKPLPIETVVQRVRLDAEGNKVVKPDEGNFLVMPMQAMIPPGGRQILKVQWLGDPMIEQSRSYRLSVNQLPVTPKGQTKTIQIVMNFAVIVHVAPPNEKPALELVSADLKTTAAGERVPTITVTNPSKVHARLPHSTLRLGSAGKWERSLPPSALQGLIGIGAVMPGQTRTFQLPITLPADVTSLRARLDYRGPNTR